MLSDFQSDLAKGKRAEQLVKEVFASLTDEYIFEDVSDKPEFYYSGDIRAISKTDGSIFILEIKNDEVIHETKNILCEEEVYYKESDYYGKGNMSSNGDIYCIVSEVERRIYVLDYKRLKEIYKRGYYKAINHAQQVTYCYLLEICRAKQWGALLTVVTY